MSGEKKLEYLTTDPITVPGQKYALVSFVSPTGNQKADKMAMKLRGCFQTIEEAREHAKHLSSMDKSFDVYIVEMYNWVAIPPNPDDIQDQEHQDQWLNNFVKGHKEEQLKAKKHFEERKQEMLDNIHEENMKTEEENAKNENTTSSELEQDDPWISRHKTESNDDMEKVD